MTKKQLESLTAGDIVYDKAHGLPFEFVSINPCWKGFLTSREIATRKPDHYLVTLKPVEGQDYFGLYKFEHVYTFGWGIKFDSKQIRIGGAQ